MYQTSHLELSQSALAKNIRFLRKQIGKRVRLTLVVKGDAYGHGLKTFIPMAEKCGVKDFALFSAAEAYQAFQFKAPGSTLTIMGAQTHHALPWIIENNIMFHVYDLEQLRHAVEVSKEMEQPAHIHLQLETGMNRLGLEEVELPEVCKYLNENPDCFVVEGTCTHLAGAENISNFARITSQLEIYKRMCATLVESKISLGRQHVSSSSGIFCYPETILDQVRVGISAYGYWPTQEVKMRYMIGKTQNLQKMPRSPLYRVLSWKTKIMALKQISPGEFIGYGSSYLATKKMQVAVIPVGYRDGFARSLSNRGRVLIRGRRCSVVGSVNMNMAMIDVTNVRSVEVGDEVVLIGRQGRQKISVTSFSNSSDDLNYEILLRLPADIPRVVVP